MKKTLLLFFLLVAVGSQAANYFTMGENDTLRVPASRRGHQYKTAVHAHFDGYLDKWNVDLGFPDNGLSVADAQPGPGMEVPYIKSDGTPAVYQAPLMLSSNKLNLSSSISTFGYWDPYNNGQYSMYGTVKWADGYYDEMFSITFEVPEDFEGGTMKADGTVGSSTDWRGVPVITGPFSHEVTLLIRPTGDVNNDGKVTISDVTALITLLMNGSQSSLNDEDFYTDDVNLSGKVDISDVTALITLLMNGI